jgi:hypothetical protein
LCRPAARKVILRRQMAVQRSAEMIGTLCQDPAFSRSRPSCAQPMKTAVESMAK